MCLPKLRKMCLGEIVQEQRDFATTRSIKAEGFRPWTMSPEGEPLRCGPSLARKSSVAGTRPLPRARRTRAAQPVASQTGPHLDSWDSGSLPPGSHV